jgi:hypothetical protein
MIEIIASIVFLGGVAGAAVIFGRKMPAARKAVETSPEAKLAGLGVSMKNWLASKIKQSPRFKDFNWIDFAQKRLLKIRVVVLKTENKINDYMVKLRHHADEQKKKEEVLLDNYWRDLKTIIKTKKSLPEKKGSKRTAQELQAAGKDPFQVGEMIEAEAHEVAKAEPRIGRVVMPEQIAPKISNKKKKHNHQKRHFKDPFSW